MRTSDIHTVAVLGAGTMGNGIAHVFARAGYKVILRDVDAATVEHAVHRISTNIDREIKKGTVAADQKSVILGRLIAVSDLSALAEADVVIEAVPEQLEIKSKVLSEA